MHTDNSPIVLAFAASRSCVSIILLPVSEKKYIESIIRMLISVQIQEQLGSRGAAWQPGGSLAAGGQTLIIHKLTGTCEM